MPAKTDPREHSAATAYYYRRPLDLRELMPAIGVGVAAGVAAFYLTQLFLQRTPLVQGSAPIRKRKGTRRVSGA